MAETKKVTHAQIVKAWEKFNDRKEYKVVTLKDDNGLETVGVVNKVTGALCAEVLPGNEEALLSPNEPTGVTHRPVQGGLGEIDNKAERRKAQEK